VFGRRMYPRFVRKATEAGRGGAGADLQGIPPEHGSFLTFSAWLQLKSGRFRL